MIAALLLAVSTFPPMLPRGVVTQLVESAVLAGVGWRLDRARRNDLSRATWVSPAPVTGDLAVVLLGAWLAVTLGGQDAQRVAMGLAPVGWSPVVVLGTVIVLVVRHRGAARRAGRAGPAAVAAGLSVALVLAVGGSAGAAPAASSVTPVTPVTALAPTAARPTPVHVARPLAAGSPEGRAEDAVRALRAAGGFARRTVVVVVPTGSGWADPEALATVDAATGGDVATVTLPYDDAPSWLSYLTARDDAVATTDALLAAVARARPPGTRVLLYGQSLGALAGAQAWAGRPAAADGALWVGPPADTRTAGGTVVVHPSDPAAVWSPRMLVAPPERPTTVPWVPVVSFVQTSVDLLGAVGAPAGHGHHYGAEHRAAWDALLAG